MIKTIYYFDSKPIFLPDKWVLLRRVGKEKLSDKAQEKLEWIIFYHTVGNKKAKATARYFGITRKTLHKWLSRFDERNLLTLEEESRAPEKTRVWEVTLEEEENIKSLRKKNMELGKKKLKVLYKTEYGKVISTWKIERVIRKWNLYPSSVEHKKQVEKRQRSASKVRINTVKDTLKQVQEFGFLWHIDAVIIWWYGERRVIFTAIEDNTKIGFARVYKTNTSTFAEDFLKRLMYLVEGRVEIIHSDNGSEFAGAFEKACEKLNIFQIYSRPYTPKDNPSLERFNRTVQEEWLQYSETGLNDVTNANEDLAHWLIKYNSYRPHETLDYLTPLAYAQENFFTVSPMWSASTKTCKKRYFCYYEPMKISKHLHSCLLIEDQGKTALIDPGNYSIERGAITLNQISKLDALCFTHEHADHMYLPFVKQLVAKFQNLNIFGTNSIVSILNKEEITATSEGNEFVQLMPVPHEKIFMGPVPENVMVTLFGKIATPGDSLTLDTSPEILALPVQAPWGDTTWATETALKVKPKTIIPIHDWHWKDEARKAIYGWLEGFFAKHDIRFLKPETGEVFDL